MLSLLTIITDGVSYNGPILLLHVRLVIFLVRAGAGEGDLRIDAIAVEAIIDELPTIIRINAHQREGQSVAHLA